MAKSLKSLNASASLTERGETLSDLLAQQKRLAFSTVVDYLDQLSEAIDLAHEQGFIHRNLNPSTILLTDEGHLVILGLRSTGGRKYSRETRRTSYGDNRLMRVTYMAPEQILTGSILSSAISHLSNIPGMERSVDGRADLYSLGVILYQMVTGVLPFQAETLEQMALMHLRMPPPPPRQFRPDLPPAAEQAMLRALAKRPADRYVRAQDLATALSVALIAAGQLGDYPYAESEFSSFGMTTQESHDEDLDEDQPTNPIPVVNATPSSSVDNAITPSSALSPTTEEPASANPTSSGGASSERSGAGFNPSSPLPMYWPSVPPAVAEAMPANTSAQPVSLPVGYNPTSPLPVIGTGTTGALSLSNPQQGNTGTLKLTGPAKIVQVPVAGQPGLYVTGLLPVFPQQPTPDATATATSPQDNPTSGGTSGAKWGRFQSFLPFPPIADLSARARTMLTLVVVVMLVVGGSGLLWFIHTHSSQSIRPGELTVAHDVKATATASANANVILTDSLSANIHNWPIAPTGSIIYVFENGAYHITDNNPTQGAPAILPDESLSGSFAYTLTMEEIKGDDTSINNEFGMIVRASSQNQRGKIVTTFYSFEVLNTKNGEYQFWKYDNSTGSSSGPWTKLWHHPFGKEFHQGHGSGSINTFKIFVNGKNFTLIVNGKQIATVSDTSCKGCPCTCSGGIGMWVNLKGTEVAFSNLRLTRS